MVARTRRGRGVPLWLRAGSIRHRNGLLQMGEMGPAGGEIGSKIDFEMGRRMWCVYRVCVNRTSVRLLRCRDCCVRRRPGRRRGYLLFATSEPVSHFSFSPCLQLSQFRACDDVFRVSRCLGLGLRVCSSHLTLPTFSQLTQPERTTPPTNAPSVSCCVSTVNGSFLFPHLPSRVGSLLPRPSHHRPSVPPFSRLALQSEFCRRRRRFSQLTTRKTARETQRRHRPLPALTLGTHAQTKTALSHPLHPRTHPIHPRLAPAWEPMDLSDGT